MFEEFNSFKINSLNPDERLTTLLKFIEKHNTGNLKCLAKEIKHCIKIVSTGQINDIEVLNKQISENLRHGRSSFSNASHNI